MKSLFLKLFEPFLATFVASLHATTSPSGLPHSPSTPSFHSAFKGWDSVFDKLLRGLTEKASAERRNRLRNPGAAQLQPADSLDPTTVGKFPITDTKPFLTLRTQSRQLKMMSPKTNNLDPCKLPPSKAA
jgi:hypothetical protein